MPDQDVPLGAMNPADGFSVRRALGPGGRITYEVTRGGRSGALPGLSG